jgi:hypothetical protein
MAPLMADSGQPALPRHYLEVASWPAGEAMSPSDTLTARQNKAQNREKGKPAGEPGKSDNNQS